MQNCYYMHTRRKPSHFNYSIVYPLFFSVWLFKFYWFELRFCWNIAVDSYRKIDIIVSNVELIWRNNTVDLPRENIKSNPQKYYINTNWYSCACVCVSVMFIHTTISPEFNEFAWLEFQTLTMKLYFLLYMWRLRAFSFFFCWCLWFGFFYV